MTLGPRWLLSSLLIAGAALFAVGVAAERHATDHHTTEATPHVNEAATGETGAAEPGTGEAATSESAAGATTHSELATEKVLGVNVESTGLVIVACALSVGLALVSWRTSHRRVLLAIAAFAVLSAVLDLTELVHQIRESRTGVAALAALLVLVHLAAAGVAQRRTAGLRLRARS